MLIEMSVIKKKKQLLYLLLKLRISFFIVVQVELSPFSPHHAPSPHPSIPPTLERTQFGFVHVSFIHVP